MDVYRLLQLFSIGASFGATVLSGCTLFYSHSRQGRFCMEPMALSGSTWFLWKKRVLGLDRGAQVGNPHLEANFGASVNVGRMFLVRFRPWDPTNPRFCGMQWIVCVTVGVLFLEAKHSNMLNKMVRRLPSWQ